MFDLSKRFELSVCLCECVCLLRWENYHFQSSCRRFCQQVLSRREPTHLLCQWIRILLLIWFFVEFNLYANDFVYVYEVLNEKWLNSLSPIRLMELIIRIVGKIDLFSTNSKLIWYFEFDEDKNTYFTLFSKFINTSHIKTNDPIFIQIRKKKCSCNSDQFCFWVKNLQYKNHLITFWLIHLDVM